MRIEDIYQLYKQSSGISTDTRNILKGSLFFALKGEHFNGNLFASKALEQGATYAIIEETTDASDDRLILVEDVLKTLQQLATYHRQQFNIPIIGITGSNGKTTTKELIATVLSTSKKVHYTKGNFNNHLGVPLTLLAMPMDTEMAVIEMGANHIGEIEALCNIALPNYGIITNIGKAHLEGFGSIEGVLRGKSELYNHVLKNGHTVFINSQIEVLNNMAKRFTNPIMYPAPNDFFSCSFVGANPFVEFSINNITYTTNLIGKYNFDNIAAALAIGSFFKVPFDKSIEAVCTYTPSNNRSQVIKTSNNTLLLDAYNANPGSMKAAIENFAQMNAPSKTIILGDMLELGEISQKEHEALGSLIYEKNFNSTYFCGNEIRNTAKKCIGALYFAKKEELAEYLKLNPIKGSTVLIKASRGIGLETLVDQL